MLLFHYILNAVLDDDALSVRNTLASEVVHYIALCSVRLNVYDSVCALYNLRSQVDAGNGNDGLIVPRNILALSLPRIGNVEILYSSSLHGGIANIY